MLTLPTASETVAEGMSDEKPINLQGVESIDFERFLWMFYNELVFQPMEKKFLKSAHQIGQKIF